MECNVMQHNVCLSSCEVLFLLWMGGEKGSERVLGLETVRALVVMFQGDHKRAE